ncbi:MAG: hypothetical protein HKP44_04515 [Desulfofustis sp.]|nr:hypothetical protein [Desulfofustis sp.]NNK56555.1 hypothetical protein [Desulfofustis sp.]
MNGILQKWLLILLLIPILILLFLNRVEGLDGRQNKNGYVISVSEVWCLGEIGNDLNTPSADVFHNRKGLKNDIEVRKPLRELNAIAKSESESIDELIEYITIWIPRIYHEQFLVYPECIIILETKINDEGRAEVRFGVAMECSHKSKLANPVTI